MELVRYVLPHLLAGCIGGLVAAGGIVACNVGGLRDLIFHSQDGPLAYALLSFGPPPLAPGPAVPPLTNKALRPSTCLVIYACWMMDRMLFTTQ